MAVRVVETPHDRDIDAWVLLKMTCIYGPIAALIALSLMSSNGLRLSAMVAIVTVLACCAAFFILYRSTFAYFWNRRARRLRGPSGSASSAKGETVATAILLACLVAGSFAQQGRGGISGRVTDRQGSVLPGATVVASGGEQEAKAISDGEGRYRVSGLTTGTYSVTASLAGFVTAARKGVTVTDGQTETSVDFSLCLAPLYEIDWVMPGNTLAEVWDASDVVVRLRIGRTRPVRSECPTPNVVHTATVREVLKGADLHTNASLTFIQDIWHREPAPYPVGQDLVVFLTSTPEGFVRAAGPHFAFALKGDQAVNINPERSMSRADLFARLHALARGERDVRPVRRRASARIPARQEPARRRALKHGELHPAARAAAGFYPSGPATGPGGGPKA